MQTIRVEAQYNLWAGAVIELPADKTIDDIKYICTSYDLGTVYFKDDTEFEFELDMSNLTECDYKRPDEVNFYLWE